MMHVWRQSLFSRYHGTIGRSLQGSYQTKGMAMAKGHECPMCGKNTLQPYTTNQLKCSNCGTTVKKDQIR